MAGYFHLSFQSIRQKHSGLLLLLFFSAGLASGTVLLEGQLSVFRMYSFLEKTVSVFSLILLIFLPFLLSAFAVSCKKPDFLLIISFLKGCLFSFTALLVSSGCGSAGWLLRFLLLFSDSLSLPLLCFFWLRYLPGERELEPGLLLFCFSMVSLICCMDISMISPFLAHILVF